MGGFLEVSKAFEEAVNELDIRTKYEDNGGVLSRTDVAELQALILKKINGRCNPNRILDIITWEFSI